MHIQVCAKYLLLYSLNLLFHLCHGPLIVHVSLLLFLTDMVGCFMVGPSIASVWFVIIRILLTLLFCKYLLNPHFGDFVSLMAGWLLLVESWWYGHASWSCCTCVLALVVLPSCFWNVLFQSRVPVESIWSCHSISPHVTLSVFLLSQNLTSAHECLGLSIHNRSCQSHHQSVRAVSFYLIECSRWYCHRVTKHGCCYPTRNVWHWLAMQVLLLLKL